MFRMHRIGAVPIQRAMPMNCKVCVGSERDPALTEHDSRIVDAAEFGRIWRPSP